MKRTQLRRQSSLRSRRKHIDRTDPARVEWKTGCAGFCLVCERFTMHLHRHHVITESQVRREGGDPWALANSMLICELCHARHHSAFRRIPLAIVPAPATDFARRLLGDDRAAVYFARYYGLSRDRRAA